LLWNKRLPRKAELDAFTKDLRANYDLPAEIMTLLRQMPRSAQPMHMLRTMVSAMGMVDSDPNTIDLDAYRRKATALLAQTPTIIAAFDRLRRGLEPIAPDKSLSFAAN